MPQNKEVWGMPFPSKTTTNEATGVVTYDRAVKSSQFADYFDSFIGNGVFPNPSTSFQVVSAGFMSLGVKPGKAWINGYFAHLDEVEYLYVPTPPNTGFRYDRVVLRLNLADRVFELDVKEGVPHASNPQYPALERYVEGQLGDYYELGLAIITVRAGVVNIAQSDILDTRLNSDMCGVVHAVIQQVDTTEIWNQYYNYWQDQKKAAEAWAAAQKTDFTNYAAASKKEMDGLVATAYAVISNLQDAGFDNTVVWQSTYLYASTWSNKRYNFASYPSSQYNLRIEPAANCTQTQKDAWDEAQLLGNKDSNILIALGTQPKINIPIYLGVQRVFGAVSVVLNTRNTVGIAPIQGVTPEWEKDIVNMKSHDDVIINGDTIVHPYEKPQDDDIENEDNNGGDE